MPVGGIGKDGHRSDDDDDFFRPSSNSMLAKIFGISKNNFSEKTPAVSSRSSPKGAVNISERYGSSSYRYIPPQETMETDAENTKEIPLVGWSLAQASVVTAYKLINNENTAQGKLGLALLQLNTEYKILIYRTKSDVLATLNISKSSKLFLKADYLQFQSDDECFWSVLFEKKMERDGLLAMVKDSCNLQEEKHLPKPIPASRSIPIVEEPLSDTERNKASLITRMARVGQSILPHDKPISTTEISDSSDTDTRIETIPRSSVPPHRRSGCGGGKINPTTIGMQMIPTAANVLSTAIAGQNMLQTATDMNFNLFMAENRMQGTEVRMNLTKLESKLDRVLDKIDLLNLSSVQVNNSDQKSSFDKDEDILALEEKVFELKKENHALRGKIRAMEDESGKEIAKKELQQSENMCRMLDERVKKLDEEIKTSTIRFNDNILKIEELNREIVLKNRTIEERTKEIRSLEDQLKMSEKDRESLSITNDILKRQTESLQQTVKELKVELLTEQALEKSNGKLHALVKEIMNKCFQKLSDRIDDPSVLKVIGLTMKQETKETLEGQRNK